MGGRFDAALRALDEASWLASVVNDTELGTALDLLRLHPLIHVERYSEARAVGARLLVHFRHKNDVKGLMRTHMALADLAFRLDRPWEALRHYAQVDERRGGFLPEMRELFESFERGGTPVATLKEEFDQRTRTEWKLLGLKGPSGAMFLNKLVQHTPDSAVLTRELETAFALPKTAAKARARLVRFYHLQLIRATGSPFMDWFEKRILNYVCPKSVVVYGEKPAAARATVPASPSPSAA